MPENIKINKLLRQNLQKIISFIVKDSITNMANQIADNIFLIGLASKNNKHSHKETDEQSVIIEQIGLAMDNIISKHYKLIIEDISKDL